MKIIAPYLLIIFILVGPVESIRSQSTSPDKLISFIRDKGDAYAFTLPGWVVRLAGNIVDSKLGKNEKEMVHELTRHIKKMRFVVSESLPPEYADKYGDMVKYLQDKNYEPLIEARDGATLVNIWGLFDKNIIKRLVISTVEENSDSVLFNIKSNIDLDRLQQMAFFKELKEKNKSKESDF